MKEFRKTNEGFFICEECKKLTLRKNGLVKHINNKHKNIKIYFDKWIKEKNEGICKICGKITKFDGTKRGYLNVCCKLCQNKYKHIKTTEACFKKYGVLYPLQNKIINERQRLSVFKSFGVYNPSSSQEIKNKKMQTCKIRYDCENPQQNINTHEKTFKTGCKIHQFKNTDIYYRGSYELDFLEKYYEKYPDIQNGPSIKYQLNRKNKVYFSDFYIPSLNLIIEIKNSYLMKKDIDKIIEKEKAVIANNFKYVIIIDKKYNNLF